MDLIVGVGFKLQAAITEAAKNYPEQQFALIDEVCEGEWDGVYEVLPGEGIRDRASVYGRAVDHGDNHYKKALQRKGTNIFPTIYLEEYYRQFKGGSSVESIA